MPERDHSKPRPARPSAQPPGYLAISQRPLHILVFLAPALLAYELGATLYLTGEDGQPKTIAAWGMLARIFEAFGVVGLHLPAILLVTVLIIWHMLQRDRWTLHFPVLGGMAMEAFVWTIPLTILAMLLAGDQGGAPAAARVQTDADALLSLPWQARLTISAGAGLYEELLFRMIVIAAAHAVLVDVVRLPEWLGGLLAVVISAGAFAIYHRVPLGGSAEAAGVFAFYFGAGLYFGTLYLLRGFGIVVAVHMLYDILALVVIAPGSPSTA
ncbi:MAG TPA: CPBP family intramembrane glutamic endopeptidase [Phycisphaerales bacterium]|nr:CPBP family intramembrane glutamic endopeptidase [Phycisphaerales bacterium]